MTEYRYIGKDGMPILARDLEDQRDAAIARIADLEALIPFVEYMAGQNEDHVRVAICGNPNVVNDIIARAKTALANVRGAK